MTERWLFPGRAIETIQHRLNASVGRSRAMFLKALTSNEVRRRVWRTGKEIDRVDGVVGGLLWATVTEDPSPLLPGRVKSLAQIDPRDVEIDRDDLLDWLNQQAPIASPAPVKKQPSAAQDVVVEVAKKIFGDAIPDARHLPNKRLCGIIGPELPPEWKHLYSGGCSTMLRALGRKR